MSKTAKIIFGAVVVVIILVIATFLSRTVTNRYLSATSSSGVYKQEQSAVGYISAPMSNDAEMTVPAGRMGGSDYKDAVKKRMPSEAPQIAANEIKRMVVKTGTMSIVVKDVRLGIKKVAEYAEKNGGFVVSSNISQSGNAPYGTIAIRIPSEKFDASLGEAKSLGEVVSEFTQGEDVTGEYYDLDAQLRNLQATEQQFLAIMKQATKIQDILDVQNELTEVRGRIEQIQTRMKVLKQTADYSSLTITLSTDPSVLPVVETQGEKWKPLAEAKEAARDLLDLGKDLVSVVIWVAVFTPVWGFVLIIAFVIWRKVRKGKVEVK
jgi:hypothetical protein